MTKHNHQTFLESYIISFHHSSLITGNKHRSKICGLLNQIKYERFRNLYVVCGTELLLMILSDIHRLSIRNLFLWEYLKKYGVRQHCNFQLPTTEQDRKNELVIYVTCDEFTGATNWTVNLSSKSRSENWARHMSRVYRVTSSLQADVSDKE